MLRRSALGAGLCMLLAGGRAMAQSFPAKPLKIVVPFAAGSPTDTLARAVAEAMATDLGQTVIVENRPGAGGTIGAAYAAKAPPDGYTLYLGTSAHAISASLYRKLPYDSVADFAGVSEVSVFRFTLFTSPRLGVQDLRGFIAAARAAPGKYSYGSSGNGSALHLATELFNESAGLKGVHVPFKGGNEVLQALLAGNIDYGFFSLASALPYLKSGGLRALAISAPRRDPLAPDLPTFAEAGLRQFDAATWNALFVPRQTPPAVVARLNKAVQAALRSNAVQSKATLFGAEFVADSSPEATDALLRREVARWEPLVRASGAQVD